MITYLIISLCTSAGFVLGMWFASSVRLSKDSQCSNCWFLERLEEMAKIKVLRESLTPRG